jgi:hypothetical protein
MTKLVRLTLRSPNGFKPHIVCDEQTGPIIDKFLRSVTWEIIQKEDAAHAADMDKIIIEGFNIDDPAWQELKFTSPQGSVTFKTQASSELTKLFMDNGWHPL